MKRAYLFAVLIILGISLNVILSAEDPVKVENFKLKDYNGREYQLSDFKNSKSVVLMFISTQCPVSNAYNERMARLFKEYKEKGIAFLGINSNNEESVDEIRKHAAEHNLGFPILKDENNVVADKFSASVTPEIYVLNGKFELLYHGRIDDSRREKDVSTSDLRMALDNIIAGRGVKVTTTKAFGCSIKRVGD